MYQLVNQQTCSQVLSQVNQSYDMHKNFYQYLLHLDQLKEFFSKSGYINRPHRLRLTVRNLEATTLLSKSRLSKSYFDLFLTCYDFFPDFYTNSILNH
ncbi:hypothetical protein BpHYR1_033126 [Brachionus plicatilis]|uniref:Uncharacterized protein n=1 Tax=Brachionus plicatilis TaxID=10195 RepID=A0A3M7S5C1_BRAPC|nr:hypothetical protein BpHYR1_033126 [Brachionus plicatilis]